MEVRNARRQSDAVGEAKGIMPPKGTLIEMKDWV
tara:strand:+ start:128 stop:229 length:102 start_codon:yes stop_codon:yes gene_type:complete